MGRYPEYAQRAGLQAIDFLIRAWSDRRSREVSGELNPIKSCWASPEAQLLSNYLAADCPASSAVLQAISEYMVVFRQLHSYKQNDEEPAGKGACAYPFSGSFPNTLDIIYIQRELTVPRDERDQTVDDTDTNKKVWYNVADKRFFFHGCLVATSEPVATEDFNPSFRRRILLPEHTARLLYLYNNNDGAMVGGFLCVDSKDRPLAVNTINFNHGSTACIFGKRQHLSAESTKDAPWREVTVDRLKKRGAVRYCFVSTADMEEAVGREWGFMYQMQNDTVVFFPVSSAGSVVDRAQLDGDLSCALLSRRPKADGWTELTTQTSCFGDGAEVPVWIARLTVPDVLHPEVLHSLAFTRSRRVFESIATKAIATAAFAQVQRTVIVDLLLEIACLIVIFAVGRNAKFGRFQSEQSGLGISHSVLSLILLLVVVLWGYALKAEVCRFFGYRRHSWYRDYFTSVATFCNWLHLALLLYLLIWLDVGILRGFDKIHDIRLMLAVLGSLHWVRVIWLCTGFHRLGKLILPIVSALGQVWDFAVVMTVLMAWYVQVSYTLSVHGRSLAYVWFAAYRLGILGDFDVEADVLFESESAAAGVSESTTAEWWPFQYAVFIGASFLLAVAMTNIFIGIMSNAFDLNTEKVEELFTRRRARLALNYILRRDSLWMLCPACKRTKGAHAQTDCLWYCRAFEVAQQGSSGAQSETMRSVIQKATTDLHAKVNRIDGELRGLVTAVQRSQFSAGTVHMRRQFSRFS